MTAKLLGGTQSGGKLPEHLDGRRVETDFLLRLAQCGGDGVGVAWI